MDIFAVFTFLLISRHSEVVSNFGFLRWNREPNTLLLSTHMTHDFEKKISPLLVAGPWKSDIWDTIAKNPDVIERKGHSFWQMWQKTCQNSLYISDNKNSCVHSVIRDCTRVPMKQKFGICFWGSLYGFFDTYEVSKLTVKSPLKESPETKKSLRTISNQFPTIFEKILARPPPNPPS